jgi:hypothetical protein
MEQRKIILGLYGALIVLISIGLFAVVTREQDPACAKIEAKVNLALDFCRGLAMKAAGERCESLSDDQEAQGQCMRVIVPAAQSSCFGLIGVEKLKEDYEALCE